MGENNRHVSVEAYLKLNQLYCINAQAKMKIFQQGTFLGLKSVNISFTV